MTEYIVYKTVNKITGHYYIGVHKQESDDSYLGSGLNLRRQIKRYGKQSFERMTLYSFLTPLEAFSKESELLLQHLGRPKCLNLVPGGDGGDRRSGAILSAATREKLRTSALEWHNANPGGSWPFLVEKYGENAARDMMRRGDKRAGGKANKGKSKSETHKAKISETMKARPMRLCLLCSKRGRGMPTHFGRAHKAMAPDWEKHSEVISS